jgi:hypothetical protein
MAGSCHRRGRRLSLARPLVVGHRSYCSVVQADVLPSAPVLSARCCRADRVSNDHRDRVGDLDLAEFDVNELRSLVDAACDRGVGSIDSGGRENWTALALGGIHSEALYLPAAATACAHSDRDRSTRVLAFDGWCQCCDRHCGGECIECLGAAGSVYADGRHVLVGDDFTKYGYPEYKRHTSTTQ